MFAVPWVGILHIDRMRLNYSLSPELYLNFLRTNFSALPHVDAVPVSPASSPDTLAALRLDERMVSRTMMQGLDKKYPVSSRS